ncbi:MAG: ATP-binding protein [Bacteroidota bacterium]
MENPFKFLDSYDKEDKDRFFGRKKETTQLLNAVHASNLVLLYGASGTGKTSLINCGLGNQFKKSDWLPVFIRRGSDLNRSVKRELNKLLPADAQGELPIRHKVKELYLNTYRPVYLIFDQFEELYIMGDKAEQDLFHRSIAELLQAGIKCKILISIREEYIAYLSEFEKVVPSLFDNRLRIEKMNDRNLSRVVVGTCRYGGIELKEPRKIVPQILDNLRSKREGVDLTNLQVYLDRLFRKDIERQSIDDPAQITFDEALIQSVGKMENVLSEFLDEQMSEVEDGLRRRGVESPEGMPLEVLFTLVTEDGTKRNMDLKTIQKDLPRHRQLSQANLDFVMAEFHRIKLLRTFAVED